MRMLLNLRLFKDVDWAKMFIKYRLFHISPGRPQARYTGPMLV